MKRFVIALVVAAFALGLSACSITLPRNATSLQRKKYPALTIYTNERTYRFTTYEIRDTILRGMSQTWFRGTETMSKAALNDAFPSINRSLGIRDILRIDAEDDYLEPAFDIGMYLVIPAAIILYILYPIIVRERP